MVRATLVDADGLLVPGSESNISFTVLSGPGMVLSTHNGDPANIKSNDAPWNLACVDFASVSRSAT